MIPELNKVDQGMPLRAVMADFTGSGISGNPLIQNLSMDSRMVEDGTLYFAVPGSCSDGRNYIDQAVQSGASAVAYESLNWPQPEKHKIPCIGVENLKSKVGYIADRFYGMPSSNLNVVGITGTNGKSTCAWLTAHALEELERRSGIIGTLGVGTTGNLTSSQLTTPDPVALQSQLAQLLEAGAQYAILEVSSHALDQSRTSGTRFDTVVFTNLSHDHLDYHGSLENYRSSKAKLFENENSSCAVLNIDDKFGRKLAKSTSAKRVITYGKNESDVQLLSTRTDCNGLEISLLIDARQFAIQSKLHGRINDINITAVAAVLHALGIESSEIAQTLETLNPVPGRMEKISSKPEHPNIYVDYAHTPEGIELALTSLRELTTQGSLWCVFGCGGDRDRLKRPRMGRVAEKLADQVILCDDNPRSEAPEKIVEEILAGMKTKPVVEHDRLKAIQHAISNADANDTVLVAGKGHESTQIYRNQIHRFKDREVIQNILSCTE